MLWGTILGLLYPTSADGMGLLTDDKRELVWPRDHKQAEMSLSVYGHTDS